MAAAVGGDAAADLRGVWREVLHVDRVGLEDDFFDLGGDSILLLDMLARAGTVGVDLPLEQLGVFLEEPTCVHLLELAGLPTAGSGPAAGERDEDVTTVSLRAAGGGPDVFVLLPSLHDVWAVRELWAQVPAATLHVLVPAWSPARPFADVAVLGERLVACIRAIQPAGPYRIVGSCAAGLAAAEAAGLLAASGLDVRLLALVNTDAPGRAAAPTPLHHLMPGLPAPRPGDVPLLAKLLWLDRARAELDLSPDELMRHLWTAVAAHIGELLRFLVGDRPERWDDAYRERAARTLMTSLNYQLAAEAQGWPARYPGLAHLVYSRQFVDERREAGSAARAWSAGTGCRCEVEVVEDVHNSALVGHAAVARLVGRSLGSASVA